MNAPDVIATCALLFTIGSFWWISARPGNLQIIGEPRSYAFAAQGDLTLNLPLVFTNTGPLAAVATNLRLRLDVPGFPSFVPFVATHDAVQPKEGGRDMATSIVIQGRETRLICCEFIARPYEVSVAKATEIPASVEAFVVRPWRKPAWKPLLTFTLRLPAEVVTQRSQYLTYDNQPDVLVE